MPEEFLWFEVLLGLLHEGAYTSRCQMPEFKQNEVDYIKREMVHTLATIQNCLDRKRDDEVCDGGYVRGGVGGGSTFICKDGVDGSSFLIPNLFTPNPVPQYSQFHQTIPNAPSSVLLLLCAICNSLLNCLTFPAWISAACLILLILLLFASFFFIRNLSEISSGLRSWMLNRHVSCCK